MTINFDVVIDTTEDSVDMKSGLDTLQGVSDATRYIAETVLGERVPERQSHKAKVRTTLRQSFKGSYGQKFSIDIYDEKFQKRFTKIGRAVFAELVAYYLNDSIYKEARELTEKAQAVITQLGDKSDELVQQLRVSSLKNIHEVSTKFGHDVKIRYRKSREEQIILAEFDDNTASVLDAEKSDEEMQFVARISRLNTNTGNGRLQIKGENETVAFGFSGEYQSLDFAVKQRFSENLHYNNGKPSEHWRYLDINASPIRLRDGKIIKYIIN
ncbi:hypothetical protein [Pseudoduganella sp. R-34]|uniref:hypothetical protein n=1 Tax=Pseudoduganella sp. R-34 TaxID=3404062 RepID=UPI003CE76178